MSNTNTRGAVLDWLEGNEGIKDLITIDGKTVHVSDRDLRKQAGNSIVVNVLHHVFESLFFG